MERTEILLDQLNLNGRGLEIGPSHSPIVPKSSGYNVQVLDHLDRLGLVDKYRAHGVDIEAIEEVDYVWSGENYADLVGETNCFDWVLASHVIEHTPDFVAFLNDCESLLANDGVLSLAIPDKRNCFDRFRPISGIGSILDSHFESRRTNSAGSVAEFYLNVISQGGKISWPSGSEGDVEFIHSVGDALANMNGVLKGAITPDIHSWCFVPSSFRLIMMDLYSLKLTRLRECSFRASGGGEFYIQLGFAGRGPDCTREELLVLVERELGAR